MWYKKVDIAIVMRIAIVKIAIVENEKSEFLLIISLTYVIHLIKYK